MSAENSYPERRRIFLSDVFDLKVTLFVGLILLWLQLGVTESKMAIEGRQMLMTIGPNKTAVAKLQAQAQSAADKSKSKGQEGAKSEAPDSEDASADVDAPKSEEPASV